MDVLGVCDMNSIGVWAFIWCSHCDIRRFNVHTILKGQLHLLSVFDLQIFHHQILVLVESKCLQKEENKNKIY